MTTTVIKVVGMTCGHCTGAVEEALGELSGVQLVAADLQSGDVTVEHTETVDKATLCSTVESIGFAVA